MKKLLPAALITLTAIILLPVLLTCLGLTALAIKPALLFSRTEPETPEITLAEAVEHSPRSNPLAPDTPETEPPLVTEVTFSFVGDCMLATDRGGEWQGSFNLLAKEVEPSYFFENFKEIFTSDDWTVANLENVFTDDPNAKIRGKGYTPAYWYKSGTENTRILTEGSVEIVSLANNHSTDYGETGLTDTRAALDTAGVLWSDDDNLLLLEKDDITIALYCTTFYYGGYENTIIKKMSAVEADYKIVYFHGGTERVHVPDGWKASGARRMIDGGIDLVIGGHPHVLQPIERYNDHTIVHSLGNFCFGGSRNEENRTIVYRVTLTFTDGVLTDTSEEIIPCYLYSDAYKPAIITDEDEIEAVMAFLRGETTSPIKKK